MSTKGLDISLGIDELILDGLDGLPHVPRGLVEHELRQALGRLLAAQPVRGMTGGRVDVRGPVEMRLDGNGGGRDLAGQIGQGLAHVIHGALRRT